VVLKPQILDPKKRWTYEQSPPPDELDVFGIEKDANPMAGGEVGKETLVVVKRGCEADIRGLDTPPYKGADMRQRANVKTCWRMKGIAKRIEVVSHTNADHFTWSTFKESPIRP
jgi:hypothetical protein